MRKSARYRPAVAAAETLPPLQTQRDSAGRATVSMQADNRPVLSSDVLARGYTGRFRLRDPRRSKCLLMPTCGAANMPIHSEIQGRYELQSDGKTVWVNGPSGDNIGRFSERGIDIHHSVEIQLATGKVCALCKPGPCTLIDWYNFRTEMLNRYGVTIADKHMPRYLHV